MKNYKVVEGTEVAKHMDDALRIIFNVIMDKSPTKIIKFITTLDETIKDLQVSGKSEEIFIQIEHSYHFKFVIDNEFDPIRTGKFTCFKLTILSDDNLWYIAEIEPVIMYKIVEVEVYRTRLVREKATLRVAVAPGIDEEEISHYVDMRYDEDDDLDYEVDDDEAGYDDFTVGDIDEIEEIPESEVNDYDYDHVIYNF